MTEEQRRQLYFWDAVKTGNSDKVVAFAHAHPDFAPNWRRFMAIHEQDFSFEDRSKIYRSFLNLSAVDEAIDRMLYLVPDYAPTATNSLSEIMWFVVQANASHRVIEIVNVVLTTEVLESYRNNFIRTLRTNFPTVLTDEVIEQLLIGVVL